MSKVMASWRRSDVFIVDFEHISNLFLVILLLTLMKQMFSGDLATLKALSCLVWTYLRDVTRAVNIKMAFMLKVI